MSAKDDGCGTAARSMRTIAIVNQKGGVAKTTTALAVGGVLHRLGERVLYVDLDSQCNLTGALGADSEAAGTMDLLNCLEYEIQQTPQGDIIAGNPALAAADAMITKKGKEHLLQEALQQMSEHYDYCIIDTAPALGILAINALTAADAAVIPAHADYFSLQGINQLVGTIEAVRKYCNAKLRIAGIVLTRYNRRTILSRDVTAILEAAAGQLHTRLFETKISPCNALPESQVKHVSIFDYAPKSKAAAEYTTLTMEILKEMEI